MLQVNDVVHGFSVRRVRPVSELGGSLYEMEHRGSGARLVWLERAEENKTFAIAFKTLPEDDTGVFHILEHSMLCGSDRYPVREPFVELLKSSLKTFLNAFTFPDKTVYPFSSRNDQDFINLLRVYMDAVLHPALRHKPEIFRQEGWHYELSSPDAGPFYKGVVLNEMKGAFAGAGQILEREMNRLLFPDTCYRFVAGGDPACIPDLTYEAALKAHEKFYHPSNGYLLLDGQVDIERVLGILDEEYLSACRREDREFSIPVQEAGSRQEMTGRYGVGEEEDAGQKTVVSMGYVAGTYSDKERLLAARVLCDYLAGTNEAPLKGAILKAGLGQEVSLGLMEDLKQPYLTLQIWNTEEECLPEIRQTVEEILEKQAAEGLDKERLSASLSRYSYEILSRETGWMPAGLVYILQILGSWLYGGDPIQNLEWRELLEGLEAKLATGYFEGLLRELMISNPHQALVCLKPDKNLGKEEAERESRRLLAASESWSGEERNRYFEETKHQLLWQRTPESKEALAKIPMVRLADVPKRGPGDQLQCREENGLLVLSHKAESEGVVRFSLYFDACDLKKEELPMAALLGQLLGELPTEHYGGRELQIRLGQIIGSLSFHMSVYSGMGDQTGCRVYAVVDCGCLWGKWEQAAALLGEILTETRFADTEVLKKVVRQTLMSMQTDILQSGNKYAAMRTAAYESSEGAAWESLGGYSRYLWQKELAGRMDSEAEEILKELEKLAGRLFCRSRLILSTTKEPGQTAGMWKALLPEGTGPVSSEAHYKPLGVQKEGIQIPAAVSFAVQGIHLGSQKPFYGSFYVLSNILGRDYLWNRIRVQGSAYGTGFVGTDNGSMYYYSYRDPNPGQSLSCYEGAADYLKGLAESGQSLDKFILGSLGEFEPLRTGWQKMRAADSDYFRGRSHEMRERLRQELLETTWEDIRSWCGLLTDIQTRGGICVVGGGSQLALCREKLERIEVLS